jgi:hypothetical protein
MPIEPLKTGMVHLCTLSMHSAIGEIVPLIILFAFALSGNTPGQTENGIAISETSNFSDSSHKDRNTPQKSDGLHLNQNDKEMMALGVKVLCTKYSGFLDSTLWTIRLKKEEATISSMLSGRYTLLIEMGLAYPILSTCLADMIIEGRRSPGTTVLKELPKTIETSCDDKVVKAEADYQLLQVLCNHFHDTLVSDIAALAAAGSMNSDPSYIKKVITFLINNRKIKTLGKSSFFLADAGKDDVTTFFCDNNWDDDLFITGLLPGIIVNENTASLFENAIREDRFRKDPSCFKTMVSRLGGYYQTTQQTTRYDSLLKYYKSVQAHR